MSAKTAWPDDPRSAARLAELESFLLELNAAAGRITLPLFASDVGVDNKAGDGAAFDPVTAADRGAEVEIRRLIASRFPDHGVIGEEYGEDRPDREFVWILDPVDGTRAFVAGLPLWTHLIGLRFQGAPLLGLIGQPCLDEVYLGSPSGSRLITRGQQRPLRVRACPRLTDVTLASTDPYGYFNAAELGAWTQVRAAAQSSSERTSRWIASSSVPGPGDGTEMSATSTRSPRARKAAASAAPRPEAPPVTRTRLMTGAWRSRGGR